MDKVGEKILKAIGSRYDLEAIRDGLGWFAENYDEEGLEQIRQKCAMGLKRTNKDEYFESYKLAMLISAPHRFDQFMQYLEIDRRPNERFYLPRRQVLLPFVNNLQDLADGVIKELFLSQPPRTGKALADDTPILTRNGWKNHGDLEVGDEVIGMDGIFKKVLLVHPKCQLDVLMEFTNGEKIQCHENHEWMLLDHGKSNKTFTRETKYYEKRKLESGENGKRGHRYIFTLPKRGYVVGEEKALPLDPYTLGVWLGDGANKNPRIANAPCDSAIVERIVRNGNPVRWQTTHKETGVMYYDFDIRKELQSLGMCHSRKTTPKRIPEEYLTASIEQRLNLLAGLLDTDGTFRKTENRYTFTTAEESLRDSFIELIATFGWRTCVVTYPPIVSSSGVVGKHDTYCVGFNPDCEIPCELERKRNHEFSKHRAIALKSITRVTPKQGNCITVEGDGMYLAGRSMIPTHNTTTAIFFLAWVMGRDTEHPNLYCSYSDTITSAFYNGLMEVLTDDHTYNYRQIFPNAEIVKTDAKLETIDIERKKHYPTFTARSLYGTLNGACDAEKGIIVSDDLISGIEEAMSKDRLVNAWYKVDNNLLPRGKAGTRYLWIGTRWSVYDPAGIRQELLTNSSHFRNYKWRSMNIPALNDRDESNFDYKYNVGFNTAYYRQRRASFERNNDLVSWASQYQGVPYEREGAVFSADDLMYYNGTLPPSEPDMVFMAVDPAWGGGDFVAAPVCVKYGEEIYIVDVIYDSSDKSRTQPRIARIAEKYGVTRMYVEGTKTTSSFSDGISEIFRRDNYRCSIKTSLKNALGGSVSGKNKQERIFAASSDIRQHMIFLEEGKRSKEYQMFMQNVLSFKVTGKNKHDDAPDSLQMAITFAFPTDAPILSVRSRAGLGL